MTSYNILIFDDDPLYLDLLESKLVSINDNRGNYTVNVYKATHSRVALKIADSVVFDIIILDICQKSRYHSGSDKYDYQGQELYKKLLECHPDWEPYAKFIILSNLPVDNAKRTFNYIKADYLHKEDHNCKNVAQIVKTYIDADYNAVRRLYYPDSLEFNNLFNKIARNLSFEELSQIKTIIDELINDISNKTITRSKVNKYIDGIKCIKGSVEFAAAAATLIQYLSTFFPPR